MNFVAERCSEELMHKLGMPLTPPKWFYLNPIGLPIVYDIAEQIALIAYPDYYAAEHNRFYRLFIKSIWLNIKEKDVTEKEPEKILEVFAGNTEYYFDTDLLDQAIRQAFAVFNDHLGSSFRTWANPVTLCISVLLCQEAVARWTALLITPTTGKKSSTDRSATRT